ncbi:uncharacterized protein LOC125766880 isoform X4 [Anopheles funestus]|uniref:uncharacterized protein LOC125766880 isoform X4 n=1 Tax=Anopheles funestus TaxID=62324 RepID=UPI0020C6593B|nr:uncharacterized protein LOC125766880 isoform X4 [Anopheles funestus]
MSSWAQRMHRRAATFGSVVTSCGHPGTPYPNRLEKVKFGVPLEDVCKNDIPGPLLVLILKLNKEAPCRKDVFRAPGNQGAMKKLIHFLQQGRLVNVDNYSVYTIASVLKKFLRKIPGGVFGREGEAELFQIVDLDDEVQQQEKIHRLLMSLPGHTQRLLVLLFGTFRVIASNSERAETGMTSEALGVSVAPSFFQSCVSDGKTARMKDVLRFKAEVHVATKIMKQMIEQFTACDLFGRVNYEYYARVTGRVLRVQDEWICSFRYPPPPRGKTAQQHYALKLALETEKTWLQCECERWGLIAQEESHSTPALLTTGGPNVHERQAARMRTRSEWFLGARGSSLELCHDGTGSLIHPQIVTSTPIPGAIGHSHHHPHGIIGTYASIDNLNDVDVNQDQENHHHHHHHCHYEQHHYNHNTHDHHQHTSPEVQMSSDPHSPRCTAINKEHSAARSVSNNSRVCLSNDRHPYAPNVSPPSCGDSLCSRGKEQQMDRDPMFEKRLQHRHAEKDTVGHFSDEDNNFPTHSSMSTNDDDEDGANLMMMHDEIDGDESDFAISQSHHFDMRAENRRRRRRRALLRRNSYDRIVASGSFLPGDESCAKPTTSTATHAHPSGAIPSGSGLSRRPVSAPTTGETKSKPKPSGGNSRTKGGEHAMTNPNTVVAASTSPNKISTVPNPASRRPLIASQNDSTLAGRKIHKRRNSNVSQSISVGNSTTLSRQSNLSMIVFSVLDFLF